MKSGTIGLVLTQGSGPHRGEKLRSAVVSSSGDLLDLRRVQPGYVGWVMVDLSECEVVFHSWWLYFPIHRRREGTKTKTFYQSPEKDLLSLQHEAQVVRSLYLSGPELRTLEDRPFRVLLSLPPG